MHESTINTGAGRGHSPGRAPRGGWMDLGGRWSHALRRAGSGWARLGWLWMAAWLAGTTALHAQTPAPQTVSWTAPAAGTVLVVGQSYPLVATASSGLPVTFRVASGPGVVADGAITATGAGEIRVVAEQGGNEAFAPASVARGFNQRAVVAEGLGQWPGYPRGNAARVVLRGNRAFVSLGEAGLAIYDVSGGGTPVRLGGWATPGTLEGIDVVGSLAYLADDVAGLHVVDVSNPAAPVRLGGFDTEGTAEGVRVVGNLAYVADGESGLLVLDVSNPSAPVRVGGLDTEGKANDVQVVGTVAYVADMGSGLQVVDVANPAEPKRLGGFDTDGTAYQVRVSGGMAYLADGYNGLVVLDVSDPASVKSLGVLGTGGPAGGLEVSGDRVFVAAGYSGLVVVDVSKPAAPVAAGTFKTGGGGSDVALSGGLAYVADGYAGLRVLDVSNVGSIQSVGRLATTGESISVQVASGFAYVADGSAGLQVLDVSNPLSPVRVGGYVTGGRAVGLHVVGHLAYVAYGSSGLQILDVSNPAVPTRVGSIAIGNQGLWNGALGVQVVDNLAYVAAGEDGLFIVNVTNPAAPVVLGSLDTSTGWPSPAMPGVGVRVIGGLAYVADGGNGLTIVDVSNPTAPRRLGGLGTGGGIGVQVEGNIALVGNGEGGLWTVDVSQPANPYRLGSYDEPSSFGRPYQGAPVQALGNLAYLVSPYNRLGLTVLDIANPALPTPVGGFNGFARGAGANGIQVVGDLAYVATLSGGLQVVRVREGNVQTLSINLPRTVQVTQPSITWKPTSSAGLPVKTRLVSGPATLEGEVLSVTGAGTVVVRAEQAGSESWAPVATDWTMEVTKLPQTISWPTPTAGEALIFGRSYPLSATASSGLPVTFRIASGPGVVADGSVTATKRGSVAVLAEQPGNETYAAARVTRVYNRPSILSGLTGRLKDLPGGDAMAVVAREGVAYVATAGGLAVVDTRNPSAPVLLGALTTGEGTYDLQVVGGRAYVGDSTSVHIVDVSNPSNPVELGKFDPEGGCVRLQVVDRTAYILTGNLDIAIWDVTDPASAKSLSTFATGSNVWDLKAVGKHVFAAYNSTSSLEWGLLVLDVGDPSTPVRVGFGRLKSDLTALALSGSRAYVGTSDSWKGSGNQCHVFDISDPASPRLLGSGQVKDFISDIAVENGIAYTTADGAVNLLDVSYASAPVDLGRLEGLVATPSRLAVLDGLVHATVGPEGLLLALPRQGQPQSLSFALPEKVVLGGEPVALAGSASSGLPVTYAVVSGPGTVTGDRLTLTGAGKVVVRATQGGDGQFLATSVERVVEAVSPPPPPVPPTLAAGAMAGPGRFRFEVTGGAGGKVAVQFSRDLQSWTTVSTQALPAVVEVPVAEGVDAGFYRALLTE